MNPPATSTRGQALTYERERAELIRARQQEKASRYRRTVAVPTLLAAVSLALPLSLGATAAVAAFLAALGLIIGIGANFSLSLFRPSERERDLADDLERLESGSTAKSDRVRLLMGQQRRRP